MNGGDCCSMQMEVISRVKDMERMGLMPKESHLFELRQNFGQALTDMDANIVGSSVRQVRCWDVESLSLCVCSGRPTSYSEEDFHSPTLPPSLTRTPSCLYIALLLLQHLLKTKGGDGGALSPAKAARRRAVEKRKEFLCQNPTMNCEVQKMPQEQIPLNLCGGRRVRGDSALMITLLGGYNAECRRLAPVRGSRDCCYWEICMLSPCDGTCAVPSSSKKQLHSGQVCNLSFSKG